MVASLVRVGRLAGGVRAGDAGEPGDDAVEVRRVGVLVRSMVSGGSVVSDGGDEFSFGGARPASESVYFGSCSIGLIATEGTAGRGDPRRGQGHIKKRR